jgi:AcrR family transcriptional regulator
MSRQRPNKPPEEPRDAPSGDAERPLRADARRNRDGVVAAARKLFEQRGVGVEMDEIARKAGVGVGTIYRHFPTKESLIQAVAGSFMDRLVEAAEERLDAGDPSGAFFEYLAIVGDELAGKYSLSHAITQSQPSEAAVAAGLKKPEAFRAAMDTLLSRAQAAGGVRGDVTVPDIMLLLKGAFAGEHGRVEASARRRMIEIVCDGLRPKR